MIKSITVENFKIHKYMQKNFSKKIIIIYGNNGKGKTSLLEAISLFTAGKGIFNSNIQENIKTGKDFFKIKLNINSIEYSLIFDKNNNKKQIFFKDNLIPTQTIIERLKIFGISPYMSLAFWNDSTIRRNIFNRIFLQYDHNYSTYYNIYNKALKQRSLLINNNTFNNTWSNILDPEIKKNGLKINEIRSKTIKNHLKMNNFDIKNFINDELEIQISPSIEEQKLILEQPLDIHFNGPHLTKFNLTTKNNINSSIGQQKKILLSFLIHNCIQTENSVLLLDDIFSNLDNENIHKFINLLNKQNIQTIITNSNPINNEFVENISIKNEDNR